MTETLTIDRIIASTPDDCKGVAARVERIMARVADGRLGQTLGTASLAGEGEWCISRVALSATVDLGRPDLSLEEQLAQAIIAAIGAAVNTSDAVRYPHRVDALADLVASASVGRFDRAWAWSRIGLVDDSRALERQPAECTLDVLALRPVDIVAALVRAASMVGFAPLHRLFTDAGWIRLADSVIGAHAGSRVTVTDLIRSIVGSTPAEQDEMTFSAADAAHASDIVDSSQLALAAQSSRLRFGGSTATALSVLAVAESEPATLCRACAVRLLPAVAQLVAGRLRPTRVTPSGRGELVTPLRTTAAVSPLKPAEIVHGSSDDTAGPTADVRAPDSETQRDGTSADLPDEHAGQTTGHAGLLFLLNVARDVSMPEALLDDPLLEGPDPAFLLARLALALAPMHDDDPALLAFAGLDDHRTRPGWSRTAMSPKQFECIREHACVWSGAVAARMGRDYEERGEVVAELVERTGRIEHDQGWVDVHLDIADVDIDIRRAGLDLDPGWVPWLGSVVRFRYA